MSKYIIDVGDAYTKHICGEGDMLCLPVRINEFEDNWLNTNIPLTPYTEPDVEQVNAEKDKIYDEARARGYEEGKARGYQEGLSDAWKAARKIYDISQEDRLEIFPGASTFVVADICDRYSASEAIEKIRQYEQEQEQIQVGDEVLYGNAKGIVIRPEDSTRYASVFTAIGEHISAENKDLTKTGRHFPEIAAVLQKMKEES